MAQNPQPQPPYGPPHGDPRASYPQQGYHPQQGHPAQPGYYAEQPDPRGYAPHGYDDAPRRRQAPPPRKARRWPWILLGALAVLIGFPVACTALVGGAITAGVNAASGPATIRYELIGDGSASSVTWSTDGGTSQESEVPLPWSADVEFGDAFLSPTTLTGQNSDGTGDLTCRITNLTTGTVIAESTSNGQYAVVSCFGTANEPPR